MLDQGKNKLHKYCGPSMKSGSVCVERGNSEHEGASETGTEMSQYICKMLVAMT